MVTETRSLVAHPEGEPPEVETWSAIADTYGGRVHVEWDAAAPVTPFGHERTRLCSTSPSGFSRSSCQPGGWGETAGGSHWQPLTDTNLPEDAGMGRFATGEVYGVTGRSLLLFALQTDDRTG
jgi:hypothetical protein